MYLPTLLCSSSYDLAPVAGIVGITQVYAYHRRQRHLNMQTPIHWSTVTVPSYGVAMIYNKMPISLLKAYMRYSNDRRSHARRRATRERSYQRFIRLSRVVFARTHSHASDI